MLTLHKSIFIIFSLYQICYYTSGLQCHRQGVCTESKLIAYYNLDSYSDVIDVSKGKARCDVNCRTSLAFGLNCTHNVWDHRAKICSLYEGNIITYFQIMATTYGKIWGLIVYFIKDINVSRALSKLAVALIM